MKKFVSSTYLIVACVILVPLITLAAVHLLEDKYEDLPIINKATDLFNAAYKFQNQNGKMRSFDNWKSKVLVVDYFFTSCPGICPKMTFNLKSVAEQFRNDPKVQLLSFTVDPGHDSSAKLLQYAKKMEATYSNWDFLTGGKIILYKLARKEFFVTATEGDGGPHDFIHSDKLVLLDEKHNIRGYYDGTSPGEVQQLITDIKKLEK